MPRKKKVSPQLELPVAPVMVTRREHLVFNQLVTLRNDKKFRGHVFGKMNTPERGLEYAISITEPGRTGKRGCKFFPADEVIPATAKGGDA